MGVLNKILATKRAELPALRVLKLPDPPKTVPALNFRRAPGEPLHLFCEIKRRSPSAGPLSTVLSVAERARKYAEGGASMISVLCDREFFDGSYDDLLAASQAQSTPLLCKEFVIDECQIEAAHAYGASAILLIVRCLSDLQLRTFTRKAVELGLTPLIEIANELEKDRALDAGATLIGVNARDLDTLKMDSEGARKILESLPDHITACHLSGIKTPKDVKSIFDGRADAALIGEILMKQADPSEVLSAFALSALGDN